MATYQEQIERRRLEKEAKEKAEAAAKLSPDQASHWRLVLANMGVPFAMSMPIELVQRFRDALQVKINATSGDEGSR